MTRQGGIGDLGLGMELRRLREQAGMSLEYVSGALGMSQSTLSRLERGGRPETTPEEVSALLGTMRVIGEDRARVMRLATGKSEQGWWEGHDPNASDQVRTYLTFERKAKKITSVEPQLVPGMLQTADYCRTLFKALCVDESKIRVRMAHRLGRQALLDFHDSPEFEFIMCELALRQPFTSQLLMAHQIRHIAAEAQRPQVTVRIVPTSVVAHPGLLGKFSILEFEDEASVVFLEGRMSGMFPQNPAEVADYKLAAEAQAALALDEQGSIELLHTIAEDLERVRERT
jgi:transcriptional regulator with XRE-family HTH domain